MNLFLDNNNIGNLKDSEIFNFKNCNINILSLKDNNIEGNDTEKIKLPDSLSKCYLDNNKINLESLMKLHIPIHLSELFVKNNIFVKQNKHRFNYTKMVYYNGISDIIGFYKERPQFETIDSVTYPSVYFK